MRLVFRKAFLVINIMFVLSCAQNVFYNLGSHTSDDALIIDAEKELNAQNYQGAIDIITTKVSNSGRARVDAKEILASGYAGKCGLNFINYANSLSAATSGSAYVLMMTPFVGMAVDQASCLDALNTMQSIGTTAQRTADQNSFVAIVAMSLMGTATRANVDLVPANGDGAEDSANISCTITDAEADYLVLGFGFMSQNIGFLSSSDIGSSSLATMNAIVAQCAAVGGASCTVIDPALITTQQRDTMRDFLNTTEYGTGSVVTGGNPVAIAGACP